MDEAAQTLASPAATWVIVIVMSIMTAILVGATIVADGVQNRENRRDRAARGLASGHGTAPPGAARADPVAGGETPAHADLPVRTAGQHAVPAQRAGDADHAERSYAGPVPPDGDETGH